MWIVSISHLLTHLQSIGEDNVSVVAVIGYLTELTGHLRFLLSRWTDYLDHYDVHNPHSYVAVVTRNENPGRPHFYISKEQLEYLRSMSFSWVEITFASFATRSMASHQTIFLLRFSSSST